jgi:hypothetical protein
MFSVYGKGRLFAMELLANMIPKEESRNATNV